MAKQIIKAKKYTVKNGDTLEQIATDNGVTFDELATFNFNTTDRDEIAKYYWGRLGCASLDGDGKFQFKTTDTPGVLYIPDKTALKFASNKIHPVKVKAVTITTKPTAKCIVKFRPKSDWKGEFGFDWMREADSGMPGDLKYKDLIDPDTNYPNLYNEYAGFTIDKAMDDNSNAENTSAYLNLFPKDVCPDNPHTAVIRAFVDQRGGEPASLSFTSNVADYATYIDVVTEIPKTTGKHEITIKSKTACDKDITLTVVNHTTDDKGKDVKIDVGKLIIPKNDEPNRPKLQVVFARCKTKINPGAEKIIDTAYITKMTDLLKVHCAQALINVEIKTQIFDLLPSTTIPFNIEFNRDWKQFRTKYAKNAVLSDSYHVMNGSNRQMLHEKLYTAFKAKFTTYADYFVIFMFDEKGVAIDENPGHADLQVGLMGSADAAPGTCVCVFGTDDDSTVSHELFHAMGLSHPFDPSTFRFKNLGASTGDTYCKTDNIMDYSHFVHIAMFQTWHWQWKIMKNNLKPKT